MSLLKLNLMTLIFLLVTSHVQAESFDRVGENEQAFFTYKPIYIGTSLYHTNGENRGEAKYQFSFKYELFFESSWYAAYTQKTIWSTQKESGPIKETNFAPEFFYGLNIENDIIPYIQFGAYKHESNGEAEPTSLQWDIHYIEPMFKYEDYTIRLTLWVPFLFQSKNSATGGNGELFEYYGKGELEVVYDYENGDRHSLMFREGSIHSVYALKYQWDIDIDNIFGSGPDKNGWNTKFFLQVFKGYGETLSSYNRSTTRILAGISIVQ